jgi:hypothetical protein
MRNRNVIHKKLDNLSNTLITLMYITNTKQSIEVYKTNIDKAEELVEDIRSMIENEPLSPQEQNLSL